METGSARMAEHILLLYTQDTISLDSEDGLVRTLFDAGSSALISQALGHLGWRLFRSDGDRNDAYIARLMKLWDDRALAVEEGRANPLELREFGWWVRAGRFPVDWMLERLRQVALGPSRVDMVELIGAALEPYARSHTAISLEIFAGLLRQREDEWVTTRLAQHAASAIAAAQAADNEELRGAARYLMSAFVEAGVLDIRGVVDEFRNGGPATGLD